ncbi:MAG: terpene cyclase/mutase family protein [Phycisphaeraceae bacterium]|nr:terpene cyclase/mutase family protein [Phycisphaeraceae bacterium]
MARTVAALLAAGALAAASPGSQPEPERPTGENRAAPQQGALPGPTAQNAPAEGEMTERLNAAVTAGLAALAAMQTEDGAFGAGTRYSKNVAITALAALAFLADGNIPGRGEYGDVVRKALEFILSSSSETGLLSSDANNGPMYGHGFATLFLGEIYGMTQGGGDTALAARVHETLVKAIRLIERTQNSEGGWRYNPVPYDADVSVTICQIMALRSARNAGIEVAKETIDRAVEYVRRCQNPDGGFRYQSTQGMSAWPRSAAGVASLYYAGIYEDNAIEKGLQYLVDKALPGGDPESRLHYFYGHYYAVQTMYLSGGERWAKWWPAVREEMLAKQIDGTWPDAAAGTPYGTAMALIVLQMPKRYLPIFQK